MADPGRKTKYTTDMPKKAYKLALLGCTDLEMIAFFEIAEQTWYNWQAVHPKLREAILKGRTDADSEVAYALYRKACGYSHPDTHILSGKEKEFDDGGNLVSEKTVPIMVPITKHYPPDTGAAAFWLKNRSKHRQDPWLEIARTELTGKGGGPIKTQNASINKIDLSDLNDDELAMVEALGIKLDTTAKESPE